MKKTELFIILLCFVNYLFSSALVSGTEPGSFFYSKMLYSSIPEEYRAVFYSPNHGETFIRRYLYEDQSNKSIMTDATPGVLYLYNNDSFEVSFDFGATWQFVEVPGNNILEMTTGNRTGEIYKWDSGIIYYSTDYGYNYSQMSEILSVYYIVAGTDNNTLYYVRTDAVYPPSDMYYLGYSEDNGATFIESTIDSSISYNLNFNSCVLHRGTNSGEIYLVGLSSPTHYEIYYSNDYGQNFELKYVGEEFDMAVEDYIFSSGNEPGSFYMVYEAPDILPDQVNGINYIYHSTDYGETFTEEYYHYFDDTFENPDYLIAYPDDLEVNGDAGNIEFQVASNVNWNVVYDSEWIASISPGFGNEDGALTVEYNENLSSPRTAYITIQTNDAEDVEVSIWQDTNASSEENELNTTNSKLCNFPNPFNPITTISYELPENMTNPMIEIYNLKGQLVSELKIENEKGKINSVVWDGSGFASGIYLYKLNVRNSRIKKMLVLK
jgi:Secretion system C-terminal sorting domain/Viral BACON domain